MNGIRLGILTGLMVAFVTIVNQLTNGEILLTVTGWMTFLGG